MLDSRRGNLLLLQETMTSYQIAQFIIISPGVQQTHDVAASSVPMIKQFGCLNIRKLIIPQPVAGDISANTFPL